MCSVKNLNCCLIWWLIIVNITEAVMEQWEETVLSGGKVSNYFRKSKNTVVLKEHLPGEEFPFSINYLVYSRETKTKLVRRFNSNKLIKNGSSARFDFSCYHTRKNSWIIIVLILKELRKIEK